MTIKIYEKNGSCPAEVWEDLVWYKRLWHGIKYIFGYKCCYGNFEEIILSPKHARQVYNLYWFLNKPNLNLEKGQSDDSNND